jgi:hypothetical protein
METMPKMLLLNARRATPAAHVTFDRTTPKHVLILMQGAEVRAQEWP